MMFTNFIKVSIILLKLSTTHVFTYKEQYFNQIIDHFRFNNNEFHDVSFQQRYLIEDKWWKTSAGPIFFYTGNEGSIDVFWKNTGFVFDIAPKFDALIVFAEHRYYGKSLPFAADVCFTHPFIDLLTVEQALADYAVLLTSLRIQLNATGPVIAFGGSYGGMLTAYMRFKYPNIISGGIAASAPIYLVSQQVQRNFFFRQVTQDFEAAGCRDTVMLGFNQLSALSKTGPKGYSTISNIFGVCNILQKERDYRQLLLWLRNAFTNLAMFDYPYPSHVFTDLPASPVQAVCKLVNGSKSAANWLAEVADVFYGKDKCHDIWSEYVECADPTGCGIGPDSKAWDYQACTELLMPAGSDGVADMFPSLPFTLTQRHQYCTQTWSVQPRDDWIRVQMWGKDIRSASNLVFSNGRLDPWQGGGVLQNISNSVIALLIDGGAHHLDLRGGSSMDPDSVRQVRETETEHIAMWIQKYWQNTL